MFSNITAFDLTPGYQINPDYLARMKALPCPASQASSRGFVQPCTHATANLVHHVAGFSIIAFQTETRLLPPSVINEEVAARAEAIQAEQGFPVGRKQMREIKERVVEELLPKAFIQKKVTLGAFVGHYFLIDTASEAREDDFIEALSKALDNLPVRRLLTQKSPAITMTRWILEEPPQEISLDSFLELENPLENRPSVTFKHLPIGDQVTEWLEKYYQPKRMDITISDRISLRLDEQMRLRHLAVLDVVKESSENNAETIEETLDGELFITLSEIVKALDILVAEHGGVLQPEADLVSKAEAPADREGVAA